MPRSVRLSIKQKKDIIQKKANGCKVSYLARQYKISRIAVYKILKNEEQYKTYSLGGYDQNRKKDVWGKI